MRAPLPVPAPASDAISRAPERIRIYEVGPRDGLQNEKAVVPTQVKAEFVHRLAAAGLDTIETTSFVPAKWVPQLGDAAELLESLGPDGVGRNRPVLVPNERGLDRALESGVQAIALFAPATESFAQANLNRSVAASLEMFAPVARRAAEAGLWVRGYVSMCWGDPWEGEVPVPQVVEIVRTLADMGCDEISLGDTIGVATTGAVVNLLDAVEASGLAMEQIAVHFHDTYGQALANSLAAIRRGVGVVDASAGGLGGCPYARSATGNLATEDLVWALHGLGHDTGVDLDALVATSVWMAEQLGRTPASAVVRALA